jgi:hypothetical protein
MARTVAGAEPESAAKKAQASTIARDIPPLTPPMMEFAKFTSLREIPPLVMIFPASTKNAIAIMEVDSIPAKMRWATVAVEMLISGLTRIVKSVDAPRDIEIGTPMASSTASEENNIIPVIFHSLPQP